MKHDEKVEQEDEKYADEVDMDNIEKKRNTLVETTQSLDSGNMGMTLVEPEKRITIKDIINSHKNNVKRKRKPKNIENNSKIDKVKVKELEIDMPKSTGFHKRIIMVNGKAQIDQNSLLIEESHFRRAEDDPSNFKIINDDEYTTSNALLYPKRTYTKKWTEKETEYFYKCLEEWGTDFSMIESKFGGKRNRTQIKNKFRKEERENSEKIEAALLKIITPM